MTMPYAVAARAGRPRTDVPSRRRCRAPDHRGCDRAGSPRQPRRSSSDEWDEAVGARVDRTGAPLAASGCAAALLVVPALVVCGARVAAYPWLGSLALVLLTWILRSGSLAASAAGDRRRVRGRKWYDGAQFLLATPWHLVRSIPGTVLLVLWSAGLALAAALLCYAVVATRTVTLGVVRRVLRGRAVVRAGQLAGADAAGAGRQPALPPLEPWAAAMVRAGRGRGSRWALVAEQRGAPWTARRRTVRCPEL